MLFLAPDALGWFSKAITVSASNRQNSAFENVMVRGLISWILEQTWQPLPPFIAECLRGSHQKILTERFCYNLTEHYAILASKFTYNMKHKNGNELLTPALSLKDTSSAYHVTGDAPGLPLFSGRRV